MLSRSLLLLATLVFACRSDVKEAASVPISLADDIEQALRELVIDPWYPRILDEEYGGFLSDYDHRWQENGPHHKMIVTQARHTWTAATASEFLEDEGLIEIADHGADFLESIMWDADQGGFYQMVNREGQPIGDHEEHGLIKTAYGNAFGIYGLAAHHRVTRSEASLSLAKKAFAWLETHSHDPEQGGYFQYLLADGTPLPGGLENPAKDQNSSIHLLEAFTELYLVWPDPLLKERIHELIVIIRDTITNAPGYMSLFFEADWTPTSYRDSATAVREAHYHHDHVSFGHDIETAYLLMEASEVIDADDDALTRQKATRMIDHTIEWGWDEEAGGFYDEGYYFADGTFDIIKNSKVWWAQVEGMNSLLIAADLYPEKDHYQQLFVKQWQYIDRHLLDKQHKGVYNMGLDMTPSSATSDKAGIWKGNYHTARSLMNSLARLRAEQEQRHHIRVH